MAKLASGKPAKNSVLNSGFNILPLIDEKLKHLKDSKGKKRKSRSSFRRRRLKNFPIRSVEKTKIIHKAQKLVKKSRSLLDKIHGLSHDTKRFPFRKSGQRRKSISASFDQFSRAKRITASNNQSETSVFNRLSKDKKSKQ